MLNLNKDYVAWLVKKHQLREADAEEFLKNTAVLRDHDNDNCLGGQTDFWRHLIYKANRDQRPQLAAAIRDLKIESPAMARVN